MEKVLYYKYKLVVLSIAHEWRIYLVPSLAHAIYVPVSISFKFQLVAYSYTYVVYNQFFNLLLWKKPKSHLKSNIDLITFHNL